MTGFWKVKKHMKTEQTSKQTTNNLINTQPDDQYTIINMFSTDTYLHLI